MLARRKELIMIIGGGIFQIPAIREAKKMGYAVLVIDRNPHAPGFKYADVSEYISTKDVVAAIECARHYATEHSLRAVFTAGTDVAYTVAVVADALGLPGIKPDAALRATNKYLMRCALHEHKVACPAFMVASSLDEALDKAGFVGYPLVIKPVDNMGARGVRKLETADELCQQFPISIAFSGNYSEPAVILEEYMEGPEISMDTLVDECGYIHLLTVADRHIMGAPYFIETGHSIPSHLSEETIMQAFGVMKKAIAAVGITRGAAKADIKITTSGAKIGEITARLSGGFHSQYTDPLATGMNTTKAALDLALGKALDADDIIPRYERAAIERALIPPPGRIVAITGLDAAKQVPGIYDIFLTLHEGDTVEPLTSNIGKAGHIIAYGATREEAEDAYRKANDCITIHTVPQMVEVLAYGNA